MIFVKICGITRVEDAVFAAACGADALGFVAYRRSPRYIPTEKVAAIVAAVSGVGTSLEPKRNPPRFVGVFVDEDPEVVCAYADVGIDTVQLHGHEGPADAELVGRRCAESTGREVEIWKAFREGGGAQLEDLIGFPAHRFLIDSGSTGSYGGTGIVADWEMAGKAVAILGRPVILAGGLTPGNVGDAVKKVSPAGVDVSSGVELSPGVKDHRLLERFVREARMS